VADSRAAVGGSRSGSMTDLSLRESEVPSGYKLGKERETAKLVKRKSLGFVHLRRGHVPPSSSPDEPEETGRKMLGKRPISMQTSSPSPASHPDQQSQRHVSYAHAKGVRDREAEAEEMERKAEKRKGEQEKQKEEGSRSFMGSVRRISLVGARRHQRTKSGVSLSGVVATIGTTGPRRGSLDGSKVLDGQVTGEKDKKQANSGPSSNVNSNTKPISHVSSDTNATPTAIKTSKASSCPPIELLPPIELQPPSPPMVKLSRTTIPIQPSNSPTSAATKSPAIPDSKSLPTRSHVSELPTLKSLPTPSSNVLKASTTPGRRPSPSSPTNKSPSSPQSASLGRTAVLPSGTEPSSLGNGIGAGSVPRRNSLGDLKIPARISQAQVGLRRDLGMVREFAANIERKPFPLAFLSPSSFASTF